MFAIKLSMEKWMKKILAAWFSDLPAINATVFSMSSFAQPMRKKGFLVLFYLWEGLNTILKGMSSNSSRLSLGIDGSKNFILWSMDPKTNSESTNPVFLFLTKIITTKKNTTHCSKVKMNGKKLSKFQFHFPWLLGTSPMSKQETFFFL